MNSVSALNEGARRVLRFKRLILFFYLINLVVAGVVTAPAIFIFGERLLHSFESERMYSNIDVAFILETINQVQWWPLTAVAVTMVLVAGLYLLVSTFLAGGAIAVLDRDGVPFLSSCGRYFPRLLRLLLISIIFYGIVLTLHDSANIALARIKESAMESRTLIVVHWVQLLVVFFLCGVVNMIFDYAKIVCVARGERSAIRATFAGLGFALANWSRTFTAYWACSGIGLAFLLAYHVISEASRQESPVMVGLVFLLRQLFVLVRMWLRLWTWSSELQLYTSKSVIAAPDPPPVVFAE